MKPADIELPQGKTCADCAHVENCVLFGRTSRSSTTCRFDAMWMPVDRGSSLVVRAQRDALAKADESIEWMKGNGFLIETDGMMTITPEGLAFAEQLRQANPERAAEMEIRAKAAVEAVRSLDAPAQLSLQAVPVVTTRARSSRTKRTQRR